MSIYVANEWVSPSGARWNSAPADAVWCAMIIFERADGETDYAYGYTDSEDEPADTDALLPEGATLLETEVNRCRLLDGETWQYLTKDGQDITSDPVMNMDDVEEKRVWNPTGLVAAWRRHGETRWERTA
ncbi:hypothetical protein Lfu02_15150 [Longispora fulva]|nr:hypothetical protein Lfu02_15150 [Longispora fulva]